MLVALIAVVVTKLRYWISISTELTANLIIFLFQYLLINNNLDDDFFEDDDDEQILEYRMREVANKTIRHAMSKLPENIFLDSNDDINILSRGGTRRKSDSNSSRISIHLDGRRLSTVSSTTEPENKLAEGLHSLLTRHQFSKDRCRLCKQLLQCLSWMHQLF